MLDFEPSFCHLLLILNHLCYAASGEKKELEEALAAQCAESKKELEAASSSAAARERGYANQLATLARAMSGECSFILFGMYDVDVECHILTSPLLALCRSYWRAGLCRRVE